MKSSRTGRFFLCLGILVLIGILVRIIVSAQLIRADSFIFAPDSRTDQATYLSISNKIVEQGAFPDVFYYQPFYYAVFLPAARLVFRSQNWSPALAQTLCAGLIIWLTGLSAAMLRGRRAGLVAGFFAAFSSLLILYVPYALLEVQQCLWITLFVYFLLRAVKTKKMRFWGTSGLILSFSILSRGNSLCFLLPVCVALVYSYGRSWKRMLRAVCLFAACVILPQVPFILRNTFATGHLSGPSTAGPAVLALGNGPESPACGLEYPETYTFWMEHQNERSVPGRILDWACDEPAAFIELQIRKFFRFWDALDIPNNISADYNGALSSLFRTAHFLPSGLLFFCFVAALFLLLRPIRHKHLLQIFYISVFSYVFAAAAFYILARFRVPAFGLLCIGAGFFPGILANLIHRKDWHRLTIQGGCAVVGAVVIVYLLCPVYADCYEPAVMRLIRPDGVQMARNDGVLDIRDNGPTVCYPAVGIPLSEGLVIEKTFCLPDGIPARSQELMLDIICERTEPFCLSINGGKTVQAYCMRGNAHCVFSLSPENIFTKDKTFSLRFTGIRKDCTAHLLIDTHRFYGRTKENGKDVDGELVARLRLKRLDMEKQRTE